MSVVHWEGDLLAVREATVQTYKLLNISYVIITLIMVLGFDFMVVVHSRSVLRSPTMTGTPAAGLRVLRRRPTAPADFAIVTGSMARPQSVPSGDGQQQALCSRRRLF